MKKNKDELMRFISDFTATPISRLEPSLDLQDDLNLYGDEAGEFMSKYSELFGVDLTRFNFDDYFRPEEGQLLAEIIRWIKNEPKPTYKKLTIADLLFAVENGSVPDR